MRPEDLLLPTPAGVCCKREADRLEALEKILATIENGRGTAPITNRQAKPGPRVSTGQG